MAGELKPNNSRGFRRLLVKFNEPWALKGWLLVLILLAVLGTGAGISWGLDTSSSPGGSDYTSDMTDIYNTINHIRDMGKGLDSFAGAQNQQIISLCDSTQAAFDDAYNNLNILNSITEGIRDDLDKEQADTAQLIGQISSINQDIDAESTARQTLSSNLDVVSSNLGTLTTVVNGITPGFQLTPSVAVTSTGGTITLTIKSDTAREMAFKVEFRPTSDIAELATMDDSMSSLYSTPPIILTAGTSVRPDYSLFWNTSESKYHLGSVTFLTKRTALTAGQQITKQITYATTGSYEIVITPVYPTGSSTGSW